MNYYKVGEEVLLYSKMYPNIQGHEVTIVSFELTDNATTAGKPYKGYRYEISPDPYPCKKGDIDKFGLKYSGMWIESALRKKPKPSTESFQEMMSNLKPVEVK